MVRQTHFAPRQIQAPSKTLAHRACEQWAEAVLGAAAFRGGAAVGGGAVVGGGGGAVVPSDRKSRRGTRHHPPIQTQPLDSRRQ